MNHNYRIAYSPPAFGVSMKRVNDTVLVFGWKEKEVNSMEEIAAGSLCELRKFVIPEIISGNGAGFLIGRYLEHFEARKPMIVTDKGVTALTARRCRKELRLTKSLKTPGRNLIPTW